MKLWGAAFNFLACAAVAPAWAQTPLSIEHDGVACFVAGQHPLLGVRVSPADKITRARVYFRGGGQSRWHSIEMEASSGVFWGTLPKPTRSLQRVEYFVQAWGTSRLEVRSREHASLVVSNAGSCRRGGLIGFLDEARVVLGQPEGDAPFPEGFSPDGVATPRGASALESRPTKDHSAKGGLPP